MLHCIQFSSSHSGTKAATPRFSYAAVFRITEVIPVDLAIEQMKKFIVKSYGKKGQDIVDKITLDMVGKVLCKFFAVPYGVEQECAAVTQTTGNVVHIEVSLNVACHEVRGVYQICGTDRTQRVLLRS